MEKNENTVNVKNNSSVVNNDDLPDSENDAGSPKSFSNDIDNVKSFQISVGLENEATDKPNTIMIANSNTSLEALAIPNLNIDMQDVTNTYVALVKEYAFLFHIHLFEYQ